MRGDWIFTKNSKKPHIICEEIGEYKEGYCGRKILHFCNPPDNWHPEEHLDELCPICREWWGVIRPKSTETDRVAPLVTI
jgi:hypothetical protein